MKEQGKMVPSNEEKDAPQTKVSQMCDPLDNNFFKKKKIVLNMLSQLTEPQRKHLRRTGK